MSMVSFIGRSVLNLTQIGSRSNPYLYETLNMMIGQAVVVQTEKTMQKGILLSILPDHMILEMNRTPFFIRMEEIVWVTLETTKN
jgi:hypothetical protein